MEYFFSIKDSNSYVHSIDNLIITFCVKGIGLKCVDSLLERFQALKEKYSDCNYWEKLNINPCRKYSFFQHAVHLDDGIYILLGHYVDCDKGKSNINVFPLIRLEINPNKHAQKAIFNDLMQILNDTCYDAYLNRYDYAIDIPVPPDHVQVFGSNKEKGLYKGTRYFGQRNKNGFCRIYDKAKEQKLNTPLTRVEHVISLTKSTKNLSFENVYIKSMQMQEVKDVKFTKTDIVLIELCSLASVNGLDYESILDKLDARKRRFIKSQVGGCEFRKLEIEMDIHDKLLERVKDYFKVEDKIYKDENGFLQLSDDALDNIPFD